MRSGYQIATEPTLIFWGGAAQGKSFYFSDPGLGQLGRLGRLALETRLEAPRELGHMGLGWKSEPVANGGFAGGHGLPTREVTRNHAEHEPGEGQ